MKVDLLKDIKAISEFRIDPAGIISQARRSRRPVVVSQRGRPVAVVVDLRDYQSDCDKMELLEAILEGEKDLAAGRTLSLAAYKKLSRQWLAAK